MLPFFNTSGPCIPGEHYMLPPERRLEHVLELIVTDYLDRLGLEEGWLVMFDLRSTVEWDERLTLREVEHRGKRVHVVGC